MIKETSYPAMKQLLQILVLLVAAAPGVANASCDTGARPSYDEVSYVRISIYSLVGQLHPWFTYEGWSTRIGGSDRSAATLDAKRATRFTGQWEALDPKSSFSNVVDVLKRDSFFAMRLHQSDYYHLDGPEDEIVAGHCGVETILTTLGSGRNSDLNDDQGRALFWFERDLQDAVFAQQWRYPKDGVKTDSDSPH